MSVFKDKVLLITGGTSSFGNAVLNCFLRTESGRYGSSRMMRRSRIGKYGC